ncbi:hypothetical protein Sta7437_2344 [Stanieria cyanosphaera PCC 7437]|uniref:Response regulatory domain-containing protein n=1 Tax=Stanieria cyanosphaera (strain ATCC 29371 / PCC 7437) TaxID=111780 RepID=K9XTF7_STAC7|nr:hypothetical protein [Stanieria cyanosphaera]AFZ35885.1 hypothetical protein Sta7437_2344 [Stanieria cyanosphaera PCC 7437]
MSYSSERIPTILLLEKDDETRRLLIENLRDRNYRVLAAIDEENAIEWLVNNQEIRPNLLVINQAKMSLEDCLKIIQRIDEKTGLSPKIPTIIIAEQYSPALEGTEARIDDNRYIIYLEDAQQLFALVARLCLRINTN